MTDQASPSTGIGRESVPDPTGIVRTATVVGGIVLAALVTNLAATLAVSTVVGSNVGEATTFAAVTVGSEVAFLLVGAAFLWGRSSFRLPVRTPTRQERPYLVGGLIASFVAAFLQFAITDAVVPTLELSPGFTEYSGFGEVTGIGLVVGAVLSLSVIGPAEEFLFRGVIQGRLREALGPVSGVGVASAVFALFHVYPVALLSPPPVVIAHMAVYYTLTGIIFGWVYYRTDNLVAPALVHGTFNAVLFATPFLA